MNRELYNPEGYADPTPYKAMRTGCTCGFAFHPVVYICSPYAGDIEGNTKRARRFCRFAVDAGYLPLAPHLLFPQFLNDEDKAERELGMFFGNVLMGKCAEVWVFGSRISAGMDEEIRRARRKGYRLRYFDDDCKEVESL